MRYLCALLHNSSLESTRFSSIPERIKRAKEKCSRRYSVVQIVSGKQRSSSCCVGESTCVPKTHAFPRHTKIALTVLPESIIQSSTLLPVFQQFQVPREFLAQWPEVQAQQWKQRKIRVPKHSVTWLTVMALKECAWIIKDRWSSGKGHQEPTSGYFSVLFFQSTIYGPS